MGFVFSKPSDEDDLYNKADWWLSSKFDPRWNDSGRCGGSVRAIEITCDVAVRMKREALGEPPADLKQGGHVDDDA